MILIIAIGFILRIFNLVMPKSMWGDMWFSMELAQKPLKELIPLALKDVHPPLYPIISHFFSYNEVTLRLLSLTAGLGTIVAIYFLADFICNKKTALIASIFVAVSPYWLQSSNEIRSYSLLACLVTFATYFRFKERKLLFSILSIASIYTEQTAWFWLIAIMFTTDTDFNDFLVCLACVPALFITVHQAIATEHILDFSRVGEYLNLPMMSKKLFGLVDHFSCGYRYSMMNWQEILDHSKEITFALHIVFSCVFLYYARKGYWKIYNESSLEVSHFLIMWLMIPIVVLGVLYPIRLDTRYLSFAAPAFFILTARGITE